MDDFLAGLFDDADMGPPLGLDDDGADAPPPARVTQEATDLFIIC